MEKYTFIISVYAFVKKSDGNDTLFHHFYLNVIIIIIISTIKKKVDPVKRYNTQQVLAHPWIAGGASLPKVNLSKSISMNLKKHMHIEGKGSQVNDEEEEGDAAAGEKREPRKSAV